MNDRSILITGGTGSFGQAFVKKLISKEHKEYYGRIVVYSRDEHKQERMHASLKSDCVRYFIGDVRDRDRLRLAARGCSHIVHAAALKIVPTAEYNPQECVRTNILGSQNVIDVALYNNYGTTKVVALSTDKAVNPINLYGATKLCMEKLMLASNALVGETQSAEFNVCRYGNVANSKGSVVEVFNNQKLNGDIFTLTDREMTRFWITLDQATDFVLNILQSWKENTSGDLYIPKMPSFKILDLIKAMSDDPDRISYNLIGIRPGEKLHEQIDHNTYSNTNSDWLSVIDLKEQLINMGII